eukprot:6204901-Pleurochrysis_carterae.AAC.5
MQPRSLSANPFCNLQAATTNQYEMNSDLSSTSVLTLDVRERKGITREVHPEGVPGCTRGPNTEPSYPRRQRRGRESAGCAGGSSRCGRVGKMRERTKEPGGTKQIGAKHIRGGG